MTKSTAKNRNYFGYLNLGKRGCGNGVYEVRSIGYKFVYVKKAFTQDQFTKIKRADWDRFGLIPVEEEQRRASVRKWFIATGRSMMVKCYRKDHPRGHNQRHLTWQEMDSIFAAA